MVVGEFTEEVEVVVIGGGPAGYTAAIRAAQLGKEVLLVEKKKLGGTCLNEGCIPSKTLISVAKQYSTIEKWAEMGMNISDASIDLPTLQKWKQEKVVNLLTQGVAGLCKANKVNVVEGEAMFANEHQIRVATEHQTVLYNFQHAIIATGSVTVELPGFSPDGTHILSSKEALELNEVPKHLLVVGGGYIGLEIGTIYRKLGAEVTILEGLPDILPQFDNSLTQVLKRNLNKMGINVITEAMVVKEEKRSDKEITISAKVKGELQSFTAEKVLVAVGRKPNTSGLGLEKVGIETNDKGFIPINNKCQTNLNHIYAIGDVAGEPLLAHKAMYEGKIAAEIIAGKASAIDTETIPFVIFTDPEIAVVGLSKKQAEEQGYQVITGKCPFKANGRALSLNDSDGYIEVVADAETNMIIGVQMAGPEVSNLISEAALAIEMGTQLEDLALTIHPHPTLSEVMQEAVENAMKLSIHTINK
ncbi:dihydrolipoyl dehydrogenase [Pueribacillus theae]|uniref:Dihydrolipoyl dehydrogenase n=1 Tax=Pueribacillus theae TaxID=2171751 RepID=A0A2U1JK51_9BACI|nr:dihydrolipoyl dehydrogenase [Pueribacillus theae]PWA05531.1 dihydrolipoyl dehydrogenase [Pueribacillus theae]